VPVPGTRLNQPVGQVLKT